MKQLSPMREYIRIIYDRVKNYPPLGLSLLLATFLFFSHPWELFNFLSANSDNPYWGFDYFGLPRCGLALLQGLSTAGSEKVIHYGPWSTDWSSHPAMCFFLGIPFSQFQNPRHSYFLANTIYYLIHLLALFVLTPINDKRRFSELRLIEKIKHYTLYTLVGFFVPYVIIYHYAQYHALSVLAFTFLLMPRPLYVTGYVLSALTKPIFAPAGILLIVLKRWSDIFKIVLFTSLGTLPWFFIDKRKSDSSLSDLFSSGLHKLKYSVPNWEQEQSLAKIIEYFLDPEANFIVRCSIAVLQMVSAIGLCRKGRHNAALGVTCLIFFTLYARGHEYHAVTLIPLFLVLFHNQEVIYKSWSFIFVVALFALPTTYPLLNGVLGSGNGPISSFMQASIPLGWAFVLQRPIAVLALWIFIVWNERDK